MFDLNGTEAFSDAMLYCIFKSLHDADLGVKMTLAVELNNLRVLVCAPDGLVCFSLSLTTRCRPCGRNRS